MFVVCNQNVMPRFMVEAFDLAVVPFKVVVAGSDHRSVATAAMFCLGGWVLTG